MKFRAVLSDTVPMREFSNVVTAISKISKECILRLTSKEVHFIISEDNSSQNIPKVWCAIDQASFFSEYQMEGFDDTHVDIYLGLATANLARSLVSLKQTASCVKIKLAKKHTPCLTIEIEMPSLNLMHTRQVTHDIPVTVIPRKSWKIYSEPRHQNYHISIVMPPLKQLRLTIDRMRNVSTELLIKANAIGKLVLQIQTDLVLISSRFKNLQVERFDDSDKEDDEDEDQRDANFITCRIDIKQFFMFLSTDQINHSKVICSMAHNRMVNLLIENQGIMTFKCFIPSITI